LAYQEWRYGSGYTAEDRKAAARAVDLVYGWAMGAAETWEETPQARDAIASKAVCAVIRFLRSVALQSCKVEACSH
jgi:hypothetical protein